MTSSNTKEYNIVYNLLYEFLSDLDPDGLEDLSYSTIVRNWMSTYDEFVGSTVEDLQKERVLIKE